MKRITLTALTLVLLAISSWTTAADNRFQQFNQDVQSAYANYRMALFQTNKNDAAKSQKAVMQFQQEWQKIFETYGALPPEVFSSDEKWHQTLESISTIAKESDKQIAEGSLIEAHETLEAIRDELSSLRQRNSVVSFSDHINSYHEVMEGLLTAGYSPGKLDAAAINQIREKLGALKYLAGTIKENAPQEYAENNKYEKLQQGLFASLDQLEKALNENSPENISKAISGLKPAYAKLFVNFG